MNDENDRPGSHVAVVRFEIERIIHELGFPQDTIVRSFWHDADQPLIINIAVIHPELPAIREGARLPNITPIFTRSKKNERAEIANWGHPDLE